METDHPDVISYIGPPVTPVLQAGDVAD